MDHTLASAPSWEVLLIPGGFGTRRMVENVAFIDWLKQASARSAIAAIVSSSGVSAGIDMALAVVQRLNGRELALAAARNMEYVWSEDPADDPFA